MERWMLSPMFGEFPHMGAGLLPVDRIIQGADALAVTADAHPPRWRDGKKRWDDSQATAGGLVEDSVVGGPVVVALPWFQVIPEGKKADEGEAVVGHLVDPEPGLFRRVTFIDEQFGTDVYGIRHY
jgi:hypothetical protein